jgi:hypothetical protein
MVVACGAASARPAADAFSGLVSVPTVDVEPPAASTMTDLDAGWAEDEPGAGVGAGSQSAQASVWDMMSKHR